MSDETQRLGAGELAGLSRQVLATWQAGPGAVAEQIETCECCGGLLGHEDALDPEEQEMAEQWTASLADRARQVGRPTTTPTAAELAEIEADGQL